MTKTTYREALKSKEVFLPWKVRGKLLKGRHGAIEITVLYLATIVVLLIFLATVGQMWGTLVGEGLDTTYTSSFAVFLVSWVITIIAAIAVVALVIVTFKEVNWEILGIERDLIARADEEVEL